MNVILAIVINMNCYLWLLEQMENKMHLNVPNNNNNNDNNNNNNNNNDDNRIIHYLRISALSLSTIILLLGKIFYHINQS